MSLFERGISFDIFIISIEQTIVCTNFSKACIVSTFDFNKSNSAHVQSNFIKNDNIKIKNFKGSIKFTNR